MKITRNQYYQLVGLGTVARNLDKQLLELQKSVVSIVNEKDRDGKTIIDAGDGWSGEFIFTDSLSVDDFLERLNIEVSDGE